MSSETELNDPFIEVSVEYHYPPIVLSSHLLLASIHGESLGEHEIYFCHAGSFRQVTLVPLVIAGPGIPKGETDRLVTTLDLYPTILEVASLKPGSMQEGKSLFTILRRDRADPHDIVFMEAVDGVFKGIFTPQWRYIEGFASNWYMETPYLMPANEATEQENLNHENRGWPVRCAFRQGVGKKAQKNCHTGIIALCLLLRGPVEHKLIVSLA